MIGLILAAGYATRLYPLTAHRAKALLPIQHRPIIDYIVDEMVKLPDLKEIIVVSNHRFVQDFEAWAKQGRKVPITIIDDGSTSDENKLGAIGDIQYVIDRCQIQEDLFVIAGDNLFTFDLKAAWEAFKAADTDLILGKAIEGEDLTRFAIAEVAPDGRVLSLEEKPKHPKSNVAVFAVYFYKKDTLPLIQLYLEEGGSPDAPGHFPAWLYQRKPVKLHFFEGECIDIGTPESYASVNENWQKDAPM